MLADNTHYLIIAAKQRHELTRSKAIQALRELDRTGAPVTFRTVAQQASVSSSWLYTQPDIRAETDRLRTTARHTTEPSVPARQRSSETSLQRRLETANSRNRQLAEENSRLRRQLAEALGRLRLADEREPDKSAPAPAPASRSSVTIGPCRPTLLRPPTASLRTSSPTRPPWSGAPQQSAAQDNARP
ncbi:DUF6262 family protein [Nonomuraea sp. MTCD27]|uniref:DUF6262 family protein n=1 Tax=Nonomuraea sp. MTCD27 TaxID=1676747 RepID=UPI0035C0A43C